MYKVMSAIKKVIIIITCCDKSKLFILASDCVKINISFSGNSIYSVSYRKPPQVNG